MFTILERKQLADGIFFSKITDGRYKTNRISISLYGEFDEAQRSCFALVPYILTDSCRKYPNLTRLMERHSDLYGSYLGNTLTCSFDSRCVTYIISGIDDRYALQGERLEHDCCELLLDCLLDPVTENGVFDEKTVDIMRQELIDTIESVKGDKRAYAMYQGCAAAYPGEPSGYQPSGTVEQALAITPQSAWEMYRSVLEHSRIEIFAAGSSDFSASEELFRERLGSLHRSNVYELAPRPSVLKDDVKRVEETYPVKQSLLYMYFKAPKLTDRFAGGALSLILGGMTTSRFFTNIREKQSLCYYCSCFPNRIKRSLTVCSGVDGENIAKTERAVMKEFMNICMMGVTEEELEHAKLELCESARSAFDTPGGITSWYSSQLIDEKAYTPEEFIEEVNKLDVKRVMEACRLYSLDTVYIMTPGEVQ